MRTYHYVGLDVHKKVIAYCVKEADGTRVKEGKIGATRAALRVWVQGLERPWIGAMEATLFTGWIYDFLLPYAEGLKVAHPLMLRAIVGAKKKNDRISAEKLADLLRCNLLPECYMAPAKIRELRRVLRYRNLLVAQAVRMKNKAAGLLMEVGAEYNKDKLHGKRYFRDYLEQVEQVPESVLDLLRLTRSGLEFFQSSQKRLLGALVEHPVLRERVERLRSIEGVGEVTALTWALEVGEPQRFSSVRKAISDCGLCSGQAESAGKSQRGPISKQRNRHLQVVLIEAAKLAPRLNAKLAQVHAQERARGASRNQATLAVARKLVAYLLAVDKSGKPFRVHRTA
jgi:transposase